MHWHWQIVVSGMILAGLLAGCGSRRELTRPETPAPVGPPPEDILQPLDLLHEDVTIDPPDWTIDEVTVVGDTMVIPAGEYELPPPGTVVPGFRVQIGAYSGERLARDVLLEAQEFFGDEVYLDFNAPMYKVRAGNFRSRDKAEVLRAQAQNAGYGGAWVVETKIDARRALEPWQLILAGVDTAAVDSVAADSFAIRIVQPNPGFSPLQ